MIRPRLALAAVAVLVAAAAGCGAATPAGELDPTLRTQLTQVDQALAAGDYPQARDALDTLGEQTATARDDGWISSQQADRILTAVSRVAADLPDPTTTTTPPPGHLPRRADRGATPVSAPTCPKTPTRPG